MARRKKGDPVHGWIIIDKPIGMNSTPVVGKVRRAFNAQKAGHGGTLDPLASGLLPIALGEATKTVNFVMEGMKSYTFTVRWGEATDSDDSEGAVIATSDARPTQAAIEAALAQFEGEIWQRPPAYSAIKVDGQRAYDLARAGEEVKLAERQVWIDSIALVEARENEADFRVDCGKGTYVRSLARDLAESLGTHGHIVALRRCQVGPFREADAICLDSLEELEHREQRFERLLSLESALDDIPALDVTPGEAQTVRNGQSLPLLKRSDQHRLPASFWEAYEDGDNRLWLRLEGQAVALAVFDAGTVQPVRVFNHG